MYLFYMYSLPLTLIDGYLQRRASDIRVLQKGLDVNSVEEFNRLGHQMMGNARTFGFPELEPIAIKMERLILANLQEEGAILIGEYSDCISKRIQEFQKQM